jgi:hypothetical protein
MDKKLSEEYEPKVKALWDWMQTVLPMLGETLVNNRGEYAQQLTKGNAYSYWYWAKYMKPQDVRDLLNNEEDERRVAFAVCLANDIEAYYGNLFEPKQDCYQKLRVLIRRIGDMYESDYR